MTTTTFLQAFWAVIWIADQLLMNVGLPQYSNGDGKREPWNPVRSWMVGYRSSPSQRVPHLTPKPAPLMVVYGHLMVVYGRLWPSQMAIAIFCPLQSTFMVVYVIWSC